MRRRSERNAKKGISFARALAGLALGHEQWAEGWLLEAVDRPRVNPGRQRDTMASGSPEGPGTREEP